MSEASRREAVEAAIRDLREDIEGVAPGMVATVSVDDIRWVLDGIDTAIARVVAEKNAKIDEIRSWWDRALIQKEQLIREKDELARQLARAVEGEREYWKKACAIEKAQHDQTIATNKAAVEQAHAALRDVNECSPWPPLQDYANWMDWRQKHAAALTSAAGGTP